MRTSTKLLLAGAGALAVGGVAIAADKTHVMNVAMPDGSVAQIRYVGDVAPKVIVAPAHEMAPIAMLDDSPMATFNQIAAHMDAQMDAMLRQASALAAAAPAADAKVSDAALKALPPGTVSYSFTSYSGGNGTGCSQSVRVTALEAGQAPKVERQSSGDCTAMNSRAATPAVATPTQPAAPALTPVKAEKKAQPAPDRNTI
jgi:hypothetical protein